MELAKYRQLYTEFWNDSFVLELDPEEKYFYIYLLTNPNTSQCGIYELPKKIIEMQTGYKGETVDKLLKKFERYKKIIYSEETKEIIILNWAKYNEPNNINAIKCVSKELKKIKNKNFIDELCFQYSNIGLEVDKLFPDIKDTLASKHKNNKVEDSFINEDERKQIEDKRNQNENELINIDTYDEKKEKFIDTNRDNKVQDSFIVKDENYKTRDSFMAIDETSETEDKFIFANIGKSYEIKDSYTDITKDHEGAHKGLASKEIISNKQEIINNKEEVISNSCCSNKEKESKNNIQDNNDFKVDMYTKVATKINTTTDTAVKSDMVESCRANFKNIKSVLAVFESNIHKAVPMEEKKIIAWGNKFSYDVIVMAIEEAIGNNIKNIGYIEKILNTWFAKGLNSIEDIKAYKTQWEEKKNKLNNKEKSKKNTVDHWDYGEQREYDFEDLERKLLGWQTA
ncbi:DnaD domain protein [Clostridium sporogenes]|nr:DnaD domain protein [Clostridium sporogenes]NFE80527.1 DnaD domain protein [Clostridium sporogenes]NFG68463.1 DnaD domain protein [Clostridium sporogenes]